MKICIAGKNDIAVECLKYAKQYVGAENTFALPVKEDKGKNYWSLSLLSAADKEGIRIVRLEDLYEIENLVFFSLQYDRILDPDKFKSEKLFNIHFSLLPEYKGVNTTTLPILHGKTYSGVTLHKIDKGIDTGDIIDQVKIKIHDNTTSRILYFKCIEQGIALFKRNLLRTCREQEQTKPQSSTGSTYFDKTVIDFSNVKISCKQTAFQVQRRVNAFCFREFQMPEFKGKLIGRAEILKTKSGEKPGKILSQNKKVFMVSTADFNIFLYKDYYHEFIKSIRENKIKVTEVLLPYIDNLNETNRNGESPLMIAAYHGYPKIVKLLVENGADLEFSDRDGKKVLDYAKLNGNKSTLIQISQLVEKFKKKAND